MDAPNPLNYVPKQPTTTRVRKRIARWLIIFFLITVAIVWIIKGADGLARIYWQHQCLQFTQPPDHVVLEINRSAVLHHELSKSESRLLKSDFWLGNATLFLHELHQPDGSRKLIGCSIGNWSTSYGDGILRFFYIVCDPSVSPSPPRMEFTDATISIGTPQSHWKFFAGQPDPANPSHFTFDYELDGTRHTCNAWLHNDGKLLISQRP